MSSHRLRHCEEPPGPAVGGPDDKLSDEAIQIAPREILDCFAEPVIGRRYAPTRWLAMTGLKEQRVLIFHRHPELLAQIFLPQHSELLAKRERRTARSP